MKILQVIRDDLDALYIFTENPDKDIKIFQEKYKNGDSKIHLWCQNPKLTTYICDNCLKEFKYVMWAWKHIMWDSYIEFACSRECEESLINNHK